MTNNDRALFGIAAELSAAGVSCSIETFRVPAWPWLSRASGFVAAAAGGALLLGGGAAGAFLLEVVAAGILLLDAFAFTPLDWLGPKVRSRILSVPAPQPAARGEAFFVGIPLRCPAPEGTGGRASQILHRAGAAALAALLLLCAAAALFFIPPPRLAAALCMPLFAAAAVTAGSDGFRPGRGNAAVRPAVQLAAARNDKRPFVFFYSGDPAETKYFLARHRGALFGGSGLFVVLEDGAAGPLRLAGPAGPLFSFRIDPALALRVCAAVEAAGLAPPGPASSGRQAAALCAAARGFRAAVLLRSGGPSRGGVSLGEDNAFAVLAEIAKACGKPNGLTETSGGV